MAGHGEQSLLLSSRSPSLAFMKQINVHRAAKGDTANERKYGIGLSFSLLWFYGQGQEAAAV